MDTNDIWAYFEDRNTQFGFQIDPDCEVIIVWTDEEQFKEFGVWSDMPIDLALEEISKIMGGVCT